MTEAINPGVYQAEIVWATPDIDQTIANLARVSAPQNWGNSPDKLIKYLIKHKHWSPFEMVNVTMAVKVPRDIGRQLLRHGFRFQEFSQRYASVEALQEESFTRECRLQDHTNRQKSLPCNEPSTVNWWREAQAQVLQLTDHLYKEALRRDIAKEVARTILPEGLTPSLMYVNGTVRNWLHYCEVRLGNGTQAEHSWLAESVWLTLCDIAPITCTAFDDSCIKKDNSV